MNHSSSSPLDWSLLWRQMRAVMRMEWKKSFFSRRAVWIYLLALAPVGLCAFHSIKMLHQEHWRHGLGADLRAFSGLFHFYYLRLGVFFGCAGIFTNLYRGEILNRTLHYYLLSPVRREVVLTGKFITGFVATSLIFGVSVAIAYPSMLVHFGPPAREFLLSASGLNQWIAYTATAVLGCLGYGAVFLLFGMYFRNPMIPAAILMIWEAGNNVLPAALQRLSVIHYLKSLAPLDLPPQGPIALFAVPVAPAPPWAAVGGLLVFTLLVLYIASCKARRFEVIYHE